MGEIKVELIMGMRIDEFILSLAEELGMVGEGGMEGYDVLAKVREVVSERNRALKELGDKNYRLGRENEKLREFRDFVLNKSSALKSELLAIESKGVL